MSGGDAHGLRVLSFFTDRSGVFCRIIRRFGRRRLQQAACAVDWAVGARCSGKSLAPFLPPLFHERGRVSRHG